MISVNYYVARQHLVEGDVDPNQGGWPITFFRVAKGWGMVPRTFWPDQPDLEGNFLQREPPNLDSVATRNRILWYQRARSEQECLYSTLDIGAVSVSLEINSAWKNPSNGVIPEIELPSKFVHSIPLMDFNFDTGHFAFLNSWGKEWGENGIGYLPAGYLQRTMTEAWFCAFHMRQPAPLKPGIHIAKREGANNKLGHAFIIDIIDGDNDVNLAWAYIVRRRSSLDVEELFVRPEYRRQGYGQSLVDEIKRVTGDNVPVRFWVPWGDHCEHNASSLICWAKRAGLKLEQSGVRWSAYLGTVGESVDELPDLHWIPGKATSSLFALDEPDVLPKDDVKSSWDEKKADRRAFLVEKDYRGKLSALELEELERLQEEFGRFQDSIAPFPAE